MTYNIQAIVRGTLFRTYYDERGVYPSLACMASNIKKKEHRISFLGVRDNKGTTTYSSTQSPSKDDEHLAFGIPRYFISISFTSHVVNVPYAKVHWVIFKVTARYRNTIIGVIHENEWEHGPHEIDTANGFVPLTDVLPSRFVLAFNPVPQTRNMALREIGFIGIDQDKLGNNMIDLGHTVHFGTNNTQYKISEYYDEESETIKPIPFPPGAQNFLSSTYTLDEMT